MIPMGKLRKSIVLSYDEAKGDEEKLEVAARSYRLGFTNLAWIFAQELCIIGKLDNVYIYTKIYRQL